MNVVNVSEINELIQYEHRWIERENDAVWMNVPKGKYWIEGNEGERRQVMNDKEGCFNSCINFN